MKVLCVAAHPDDEVLGAGATLARLAKEGHSVWIAILGEGLTSRYATREEADPAELKALQECARRAASLLGARDVTLHGLPDNRFDSVPLLDVVKIVESVVAKVQPDVIYTHCGGDLNIDHATTHRAVLTATRPMRGSPVQEIYAFEVPSSTEWAFQQFEPAFRPNVFLDISGTLETKIKAMAVYESEMKAFPHPRSREALTALAQVRGSMSGLPAAEAFELIRKIG
jgi:LmbE family N-acetylglucosaminyl deacetylase